jgi:UDP-glucose 4-epimerase
LGRILVTGGAGYIGSAITEMLSARGAELLVLDNFSQGHRDALSPHVAVVEANLGDPAALERVFTEHSVAAVIHLAAVSVVADSVSQPLRYYRENVVNLLHLLEAMRRTGCGQLVFSSTAAVYGVPEAMPITEASPLAPINPYGWTKRVGEQILADTISAPGNGGAALRYVALRYFNVAGASPACGEMHHPETHLVPRVLEVALGLRPFLELYGSDYDTPDGTCIRDYIHILDLAEAHLLALDYTQKSSGVFNLGNNQGFSVREVVECARRITGHPIPLREFPRRPGDPPRLVASHARARAELGWQPRRGLEEMIASAWEWRRAHRDGYAR